MLNKLFASKGKASLPWKTLQDLSQLEEVDKVSNERPVLLFKHSTRCSISSMALGRFERSYDENAEFEPYYLDLISYRELSNEIASRYGVRHESPQAILIIKGKAVYDTSHMGISYDELNSLAKKQ